MRSGCEASRPTTRNVYVLKRVMFSAALGTAPRPLSIAKLTRPLVWRRRWTQNKVALG